jgi:hypothetical protein
LLILKQLTCWPWNYWLVDPETIDLLTLKLLTCWSWNNWLVDPVAIYIPFSTSLMDLVNHLPYTEWPDWANICPLGDCLV